MEDRSYATQWMVEEAIALKKVSIRGSMKEKAACYF